MVEHQVQFLCSLASTMDEKDEMQTLLRSYYLMKCKDITRGFGLPAKQFSPLTRCPKCCLEWNHSLDSKMKSLKLTRRQKRKNKLRQQNKEGLNLTLCNQLESICSICKHKTVNPLQKPDKGHKKSLAVVELDTISEKDNKITSLENTSTKKNKNKNKNNFKPINAYTKTKDIFSLQNNRNTIVKPEKLKVIKNNKKKRDKFAGLCQKAVLTAAAEITKKQKKDNLSLFLKPSSN